MRVLVVDDDVSTRFPLERALRKDGIETASATSVRHAMDRLRSEPFDVLITDVMIAGVDGTPLLQWLGSFSPSTHTFIVAAAITDEIRSLYGKAGVRIFEKPVDHAVLIAALEEAGPRRGFYGNAIEVEFFDYVQMVALSGRDKLVEVQTPSGTGLIWFEHGDIVHCEYEEFRGETAFYKLLAVNRGTFREQFNRRAPRHTVTRSSTHLLIEAARQADEGILGQDPAKSESSGVIGIGEATAAEAPPSARPTEIPVAVPRTRTEPSLVAVERSILPVADDDVSHEVPIEEESSFEELNDEALADAASSMTASIEAIEAPRGVENRTAENRATEGRALDEATLPRARPLSKIEPRALGFGESSIVASDDSAAMSTAAGHAIFDDPDTRSGMLDQFWQFEGINGVAIISSTGKVLAEDMRTNSSLVTLAGFYMRGAARIARTLGFNVFDGVVARSVNGQQMVMVSMGAASAVLSVEPSADPEAVRDAVMGVE
jgi:CheY-like chemotaxis protein